MSSRATQTNFVERETDGKRKDRAGLTRNALGHTSDETFPIRNVARRSRRLLDEPRGAQVQHSAIRAADANLVAVAGDSPHRAGCAEEGDRPLVSNISYKNGMGHGANLNSLEVVQKSEVYECQCADAFDDGGLRAWYFDQA